MKVKEIMTRQTLQYCTPETRLHNAAKAMKETNIGALPVLDESKRVVGIVTDRDICLSLADKRTKEPSQVKIGEIMSKKVATVSSEADLNVALREMRTKKVGRLPVVDEAGKLKGVLSLHSLLSKAAGKKTVGGLSEEGEAIIKTVKAITDRYAGNGKKAAAPRPIENESYWED